jgi:putative MFS transporter
MLFSPALLPRMAVGAFTLIVANTLIYGFVTWLPTPFVQEGRSIATSFGYSFVLMIGTPVLTMLLGGIYPFIEDPVLLPNRGFVTLFVAVALYRSCGVGGSSAS